MMLTISDLEYDGGRPLSNEGISSKNLGQLLALRGRLVTDSLSIVGSVYLNDVPDRWVILTKVRYG